MWKKSSDLLSDIRSAHERLVTGKSSVQQASAEARLFSAAGRTISVTLKHAELSQRIVIGNDALPDMKLPEPAAK